MVTNAANQLLEYALGASHACFEFVKGAVEHNGWTPEECSDILLVAERTMRESNNPYDVYRRRNAISLLGDFGGTNALPELARLMQSPDKRIQCESGVSFLRVSKANPDLLHPLIAEIARSPSGTLSLAWRIYQRVDFDLTYDAPSPALQRNLLRFLLDQSAVEQGERAMLDEILCREVPKWRASPQRLANAERMIREHSNDAGAVSFFEGVRADALSAGASAREQNPDGRSSGSPADSPKQGDDSKDAADPWADLLEDLPEKQPWGPPDGMVPAS